MEDSITYFSEHYYNIAIALAIAIIGFLFATYTKKILNKSFTKFGDDIVKSFIINIIYILILVLVGITVLTKLGVPTASLLTVLGASSIAIALALKDSLSNIAAGILLLINKPFKKGDFIDANGIAGTVEQINLFTTTLKTPVNESIYMPNTKLASDKIVNKTAFSTRRLDLNIGVGYESNIQQVKTLLEQFINEDKRILKKPEPLIAVTDLADSAVIVVMRLWVKKADFVQVRFDMLETVKTRFDENNISIPFPQQDVYIKQFEKNNSN